MKNVKEVEPKEVFNWFYELNQIPRCSGQEKEVSDFLVDFAQTRDLEVHQDEIYNVIIKKPGTKGYENADPVIIQGHMDMVCVKGEASDHDFSSDPIEMIVEDDFLKANNTTLGADDGIAVAYALAILASDDLKHPPLEVLITTNEETGMDGVHGLENTHLSGKTLLNIDSEEEGTFLVSCAGGATKLTKFALEKEDAASEGLKISISGLEGGHSGMEIIKQRANAIKLMGRILDKCRRESEIKIGQITGGIKHNAIPSNARVELVAENIEDLKTLIEEFAVKLKAEYSVEDPNLEIEVNQAQIDKVYTLKLTENLIDFLMMTPDGVQYMSRKIDGLVKTSLTNAIIEEKEDIIQITSSVRSASNSSLREILNVLEVVAKRSGAEIEEEGNYPAWQYNDQSEIKDKALAVYQDLFEKDAEVTAIHAGLECGLLKEILPETEMISFGPNLYDVHTENEHLSIPSAQRIWKFLTALLAELK